MTTKQYQREEGGFSVLINGIKKYGFREKHWMNNLKDQPDPRFGSKRTDHFTQTQRDYNGYEE